MATWTYAGEMLKNGFVREFAAYEGAWTAKSVTTSYGDIENTTPHPVGYYAAPIKAGDYLRWYTSADDTVEKAAASDDGKLIVGFAVDNPHGTAGGTRRVKVYMLAPGDIILAECDATHTAIAINDAIDLDVVAATALHGLTVNKTAGTGIGKAMNALALNTAGKVLVRIVTVPGA